MQRGVPRGLGVNTLANCWYTTVGHHPDDVQAARALAPWYRQKAQPSVLDMFVKLRHVIIAVLSSGRPGAAHRTGNLHRSPGQGGVAA